MKKFLPLILFGALVVLAGATKLGNLPVFDPVLDAGKVVGVDGGKYALLTKAGPTGATGNTGASGSTGPTGPQWSTSSQVASAISDETGTGALVFSADATLTGFTSVEYFQGVAGSFTTIDNAALYLQSNDNVWPALQVYRESGSGAGIRILQTGAGVAIDLDLPAAPTRGAIHVDETLAPTLCDFGEFYVESSNHQLYYCSAPNVWSQVAGAGPAGSTGPTGPTGPAWTTCSSLSSSIGGTEHTGSCGSVVLSAAPTLTGSVAVSGSFGVTGAAFSKIPATVTTSGNTATIDWSLGNAIVFSSSGSSGNITFTFSNPQSGGSYVLKLIQGATPRTYTWPANVKWPSAVAPTVTAISGAVDMVSCLYDGSSYLCTFALDVR